MHTLESYKAVRKECSVMCRAWKISCNIIGTKPHSERQSLEWSHPYMEASTLTLAMGFVKAAVGEEGEWRCHPKCASITVTLKQ